MNIRNGRRFGQVLSRAAVPVVIGVYILFGLAAIAAELLVWYIASDGVQGVFFEHAGSASSIAYAMSLVFALPLLVNREDHNRKWVATLLALQALRGVVDCTRLWYRYGHIVVDGQASAYRPLIEIAVPVIWLSVFLSAPVKRFSVK